MKAFPTPATLIEQGMDLRDYFAAAALQGFLASHAGLDIEMPNEHAAATRAYQYADALLKVRQQ